MNVVLILLDTLNRHYLSCYGNTWMQTPNIQRLADRSLVFDNHFTGSLASMPARHELFSGRKEFLWRGWGHAEPFDDNLAKLAAAQGAYTCISTDHAHYWDRSHGYGYTEHFEDRHFVRGQEGDRPIKRHVTEDELPQWVLSLARYYPMDICMRYYRNMMDFETAEDFQSAQVMRAAAEAIDGNASRDKFYIQAEGFDPHEPWFNPEPYRSMYGPYRDDVPCWLPYPGLPVANEYFANVTTEELEAVRQQYAGNVSMVDHQVGKVLDALDRNDLWKDTVVILTTDHGQELGERGRCSKCYPHYNLHAHIPLIIWHPDHPGPRRTNAYSNMVDIHSTIVDVMGDADYRAPHGRSLLSVIRGEQEQVRNGVLYGFWGTGACWVDDDYTIFSGYDNEKVTPLYYSTMIRRSIPQPQAEAGRFMPDVDHPLWRYPVPPERGTPTDVRMPLQIYARADHDQLEDLSADEKIAEDCRQCLRAALDEETCPPEAYRRFMLEP